jgi:hypothetical protein
MFKLARDRKIFQSLSDEDRRSQREPLSKQKISGFKSISTDQRWKYFLNEVLGQEEIWVPFAPDGKIDGWYDPKHDVDIIPVWPNKEFCEQFTLTKEKGWSCVPIPIVDWIDVVTPEIVASGNLIAVFPIDNQDFEMMAPEAMLDEWENEWKRYVKYQLKYEDLSAKTS